MDSVTLKRPAVIVAIVTEQFRQQASAELQQGLQQTDQEAQQLEFQGKRAIAEAQKRGASPAEVQGLDAQLEAERARLRQQKGELMQKLDMIGKLNVGEEFVQGQMDVDVPVRVGDHLYAKLSPLLVVVKDGVVQELRGGA